MRRNPWLGLNGSGRAVAVVVGLVAASVQITNAEDGAPLAFTHTFTGEPLDVTPPAGETPTEASVHFLETAENLYVGDAAAITKGGEIYLKQCAVCHGIKANGRMGPSLIDDQYVYEKNSTDKGKFETIWGGAAGLMAPLKGRITQDEILKVMSYLTSLKVE